MAQEIIFQYQHPENPMLGFLRYELLSRFMDGPVLFPLREPVAGYVNNFRHHLRAAFTSDADTFNDLADDLVVDQIHGTITMTIQ